MWATWKYMSLSKLRQNSSKNSNKMCPRIYDQRKESGLEIRLKSRDRRITYLSKKKKKKDHQR